MSAPRVPIDGWVLGEAHCAPCDRPMDPIAYWAGKGEGWYLHWMCPRCVHDDIVIDWPFQDDYATALDLEALGFRVDV